MKKEKRIKKQLTTRLDVIISVIIAVVFGSISFYSLYVKNAGIDVSSLIAFATVLFIFLFCYYILLKGTDREIDEEEKALQADIKKFLCTGKFTELLYAPKSNDSETEMILGILKEVGCRFLAKLDENENIILVVYDKDDRKVWEEKIENYFYFHAKFKAKNE